MCVHKEKDTTALVTKKSLWGLFFDAPTAFGDDFLAERDNEPPPNLILENWHVEEVMLAMDSQFQELQI